MDEIKTRSDLAKALKDLRATGYKYMVRQDNSPFIELYAIKPVKTNWDKWKYKSESAAGTLPVKEIRCVVATEIKFENPKPTCINEWLKVYG